MIHLTDQAIGHFIGDHYLLLGILAWLASSAISTLPSPDPKDSKWYNFIFNLFHSLAGNPGRISGIRNFISKINGGNP